ncbi:hypothetical protein DFR67_13229 [Williamsia limnetica]|uniref:Uncharacterized protein n=1 Tax=Williamsia limnetica TaxID=882452 RepID=A0A318RDX7_WILLI|nr:hypothetical protein DFR67_13229 [Williamsia limnetica]
MLDHANRIHRKVAQPRRSSESNHHQNPAGCGEASEVTEGRRQVGQVMQRGHRPYDIKLPAKVVGHYIADEKVDSTELRTSGIYDVAVQVNSSDVRYLVGQISGEEAVTGTDIKCGDRIIGYRFQHYPVIVNVVVPA